MQPIGAISGRMMMPMPAAMSPSGAAADGADFQEVWRMAVRHADRLTGQARADGFVSADTRHATAEMASAQATLDAMSQLCDRALGAFNEIKDLRI